MRKKEKKKKNIKQSTYFLARRADFRLAAFLGAALRLAAFRFGAFFATLRFAAFLGAALRLAAFRFGAARAFATLRRAGLRAAFLFAAIIQTPLLLLISTKQSGYKYK